MQTNFRGFRPESDGAPGRFMREDAGTRYIATGEGGARGFQRARNSKVAFRELNGRQWNAGVISLSKRKIVLAKAMRHPSGGEVFVPGLNGRAHLIWMGINLSLNTFSIRKVTCFGAGLNGADCEGYHGILFTTNGP